MVASEIWKYFHLSFFQNQILKRFDFGQNVSEIVILEFHQYTIWFIINTIGTKLITLIVCNIFKPVRHFGTVISLEKL